MRLMKGLALASQLQSILRREVVTAIDVRDSLEACFRFRVEPFIRGGLRYSDPEGGDEAFERRFQNRVQLYFKNLSTPYKRPALRDLREVRAKMASYGGTEQQPSTLWRMQETLIERLFDRAAQNPHDAGLYARHSGWAMAT